MSKFTKIAVIFLLILSIFQHETSNKYTGVLCCILIVLMNIANNQTKDDNNDTTNHIQPR